MASLSGSEFIAEYLIKEGCPYIIGLPGHGVLAFMDAFRKRRNKIKSVMVRHEQSAVHVADAYFRVTGKPIAAFTTVGPGALNAVMATATAFMDSTAVVVITTDCPVYMNERGAMRDIHRIICGVPFRSISRDVTLVRAGFLQWGLLFLQLLAAN